MNKENKQLLDDEISGRFNILNSVPCGGDDDEKIVESIEKLYRLRIEEEKIELDDDKRYTEHELDIAKYEDQKKSDLINKIIEAAEFIVTTGGTFAFVLTGYYYEYRQSGMYSSTWFRNIVNTVSRLIGVKKN